MIEPPVGQDTLDREPLKVTVLRLPPRPDEVRRAMAAWSARIWRDRLASSSRERGGLAEGLARGGCRPVRRRRPAGHAASVSSARRSAAAARFSWARSDASWASSLLHLQVFLGGGELVEEVGVVGVLDIEEGPLLGGLTGIRRVEGGQGVVRRGVHEGLDGEVADVVTKAGDLGRLGLHCGRGLVKASSASVAARCASASRACWPATCASRASSAAETSASVALRASTCEASCAFFARTASRSADGLPPPHCAELTAGSEINTVARATPSSLSSARGDIEGKRTNLTSG